MRRRQSSGMNSGDAKNKLRPREHDAQSVAQSEIKKMQKQNRTDYKKDLQTCKDLLYEPHGNVYRGWAIGIPGGPRTMLLTVLCIMTQILLPFFLNDWNWHWFTGKRAVPVWDHWRNITISSVPGEDPTMYDLYRNDQVHLGLQLKIAGVVLMLLIHFSNDTMLLRQDMQANMLRVYFGQKLMGKGKRLKKRWMWLDALCLSWATGLIACAIIGLFFGCETMSDLVLDSFGLLFLSNLDDYAHAVEYGVDDRDFEQLVKKQRNKLYALQDKKHEYKKQGLGPFEDDMEKAHSFVDFTDHLSSGDFCFTAARICNAACIVVHVPMWAVLHFEAVDGRAAADDQPPIFRFWSEVRQCHVWVPISIVATLLWCLRNLKTWYDTISLREFRQQIDHVSQKEHEQEHEQDDYDEDESNDKANAHTFIDPEKVVLKKDFTSFIYFFLFRRPDPRLPENLMTTALSDSDTEDDEMSDWESVASSESLG